MCVEIELGNRVIETINELAALIGKENIVIDSRYHDVKGIDLLDREFCLCPLDISSTASKAGYVSQGTNDWHIGYRWTKEKPKF